MIAGILPALGAGLAICGGSGYLGFNTGLACDDEEEPMTDLHRHPTATGAGGFGQVGEIVLEANGRSVSPGARDSRVCQDRLICQGRDGRGSYPVEEAVVLVVLPRRPISSLLQIL